MIDTLILSGTVLAVVGILTWAMMRKTKRERLEERILELVIKEVERGRSQGADPKAVLEKALQLGLHDLLAEQPLLQGLYRRGDPDHNGSAAPHKIPRIRRRG